MAWSAESPWMRLFRSSTILDAQICRMICPIAAAMVGVCLTGISLLRVAISITSTSTLADDLLAFDAALFLAATLASYIALRVQSSERIHWLERIADATFMLAMILLTVACFLITYAITL